MRKFEKVENSGSMHVNEHGGNRDTSQGKLDYTLIPIEALDRVAQHYVNGLKKYGRDNWKKLDTPEDIERYKQSMFRHMMQYLKGETNEDHISAVIWNAMALIYYDEKEYLKEKELMRKTMLNDMLTSVLNSDEYALTGSSPVFSAKI